MLAAASIKVMDALVGFVARNDAECCKRELLGRSWRRDWAMRNFRHFSGSGKFSRSGSFFPDPMLGVHGLLLNRIFFPLRTVQQGGIRGLNDRCTV